MSFIGDALKEAVERALKEIDEQVRTMTFQPVGDILRSMDNPYERYVEFGDVSANIIESTAIVLDDETPKLLPAPNEQGTEGRS